MKIYTRTGDRGETDLFGGTRVSKTHPRVEAYGNVDEVCSLLGVAIAHLEGSASALADDLSILQEQLFVLAADLATPSGTKTSVERIGPAHAAALEEMIDLREQDLPQLDSFVLPGGTRAASFLHLARTVCRRAERAVLAVPGEDAMPRAAVYLNRLSDLLFVMARAANHLTPDAPTEVLWRGR